MTTGAVNKATLNYGDNKEISDTTSTHSWQLPVFKYYNDGTSDKGLKDATFAIRRKKRNW